ncbi:hypothetical protein [Tepidibacter hydrothermalis]|uniref:Uncharacterized protein n=1 Tax=Tepidibacter hydrothermalis TaxID=3036126 RepID=A0ABY8EEX0_9FIRM|nr:hypothetical protein [Tepidibacter hydrothermalis]WFD11499.1 hypothetical protein P4S50_05335 [Tepidibacter hydrothermalis]
MSKGLRVFFMVSVGFIPMVLHWSISSSLGLILGSFVLVALLIKESFKKNISLMTKTLTLYFLIANVLYFIFDINQVIINRHLYTYISLGTMSLYSLIIRKPFTMDGAKSGYKKGFESSPLFIEVNMLISTIWCATYIISSILRFIGDNLLFVVIPNILISVAIACSIIIPNLMPDT